MTNCKAGTARGKLGNNVKGLHRNTLSAYESIQCSLYQSLVDVSTRLMIVNRNARSLQRETRFTVRGAAESTRGLFVDAPGAIDKSWGVTAGSFTSKGESARRELLIAYRKSRCACCYIS